MIHAITLRNFRAFKNQQFHFRKLNIFVGPNNSGKSSAISALNLLAQTVLDQELDGTPLILNGQYDKLGTFIDVVHGNRSNRPIGIDISFDQYSIKTEYKYRTQRRQIELSYMELFQRESPIFKFQQRKDAFDVLLLGKPTEKIFPDTQKRRPRFRNFWPIGATSPIAQFRHQTDENAVALRRRAARISSAIFEARSVLEEHFLNFDSISPFRDKPQRTYLYSGESARQVGVSGSNTAALLAGDAARRGTARRNLVERVSSWFSRTGIARGLSVVTLTPRHFELCLVSNDGTKHNICDVGFGCSQVLPVLASGLNLFHRDISERDERRILIVQEPEIHLHPNAQAELGSFFVDLSSRGGQVFIETHSDNLVLRVARHVALGDIKPQDVAIFFVSDQFKDRVTEVSINHKGQFVPDWPGGFFPQRQEESLSVARAAYERARDSGQVDLPLGSAN